MLRRIGQLDRSLVLIPNLRMVRIPDQRADRDDRFRRPDIASVGSPAYTSRAKRGNRARPGSQRIEGQNLMGPQAGHCLNCHAIGCDVHRTQNQIRCLGPCDRYFHPDSVRKRGSGWSETDVHADIPRPNRQCREKREKYESARAAGRGAKHRRNHPFSRVRRRNLRVCLRSDVAPKAVTPALSRNSARPGRATRLGSLLPIPLSPRVAARALSRNSARPGRTARPGVVAESFAAVCRGQRTNAITVSAVVDSILCRRASRPLRFLCRAPPHSATPVRRHRVLRYPHC